MPLQHVSGNHYIRRVRVFVDPDERDKTRSRDQFKFLFPLKNLYEKVAAIELVDYNVRSPVQEFAYEQQGRFSGANKVDIRMVDVATGLQTLDFTVTLPPGLNTDYVLFMAGSTLNDLFNDTMDAQGHAFFNTANNVFWTVDGVGVSSARLRNFYGHCQPVAIDYFAEHNGVADSILATFLFGTGPNVANSAAIPLGFEPGVDTTTFVSGGVNYFTPQQKYELTKFSFRYLNVEVEEVPELKPLARIFLTNTAEFVKTEETRDKVRLLVNPLKRVEELRINLTLPGGRIPETRLCAGVDLVFDLYLISAENEVPNWVQQKLVY